MKTSRSFSVLFGLLALLVAAPARADYPIVSTITVAGSGGGADAANAIAQDNSGNIYVAGSLTLAGGDDIWIAKYSPALVLLSSYTYDQAGFSDVAYGVCVDTPTGNVFVAGNVSGSALASSSDIWLAKFDSSLVLQASVTLNGSASDFDAANAIRISSGQLYVVGHSSVTGGKGQWAARYDTNLVLLSSMTFVQYDSYGKDILPVAGGDVFVAGSRAPNFATSVDAWIGRFSSTWVLLASATINGSASNNDEFRRLADDGSGGVYAVGYLNTAGAGDRFIQRYDSNLVRVSSSLVNGPGNLDEYLTDILVTSSGTLLVAGEQSQVAGIGGRNAIIAEYSSGLALLSSTSYTTSGSFVDHAYALLIGANQDVYAAGWVGGANQDAWIARYSTSPAVVASSPTAPSGFAGTAQSTNSILWSWTDNSSDETGFRVKFGGTNVSGELSANATTWLQTGLGVNTSSGSVYVQVFNATGTADSSSLTRYSLAEVPTGLGSSGVTTSNATISWSGSATLYQLERSTGGGYTIISTGVATSYGNTGLSAASTYYYRVLGYNGDSIATAYTSTITVVTTPVPGLVSIAVTPSAATIPTSSATLFTAVGTFSDGSTRTLNGTWQSKAAMNESRSGSAAAFSGGKLYVLGGSSSPGLPLGTFSVEAYDPTTDSWTYRTASPVRRAYPFYAEYGGKIYIAGGCTNSDCNSPTTALYEYDTALNSWAAKAALPVASFQAAMEQISGKLYAAGGHLNGYLSTSTLRVYDPVGNTWTTKASMPYPRAHAASGVINGKMYVAGGRVSSATALGGNELQIYDPVADTWSLGAPMPSGRSATSGVVHNGRLYVLAGDRSTTATVSTDAARVQIYDAASNTWIEGPALQVSRYNPAAGVYQGMIHVAGASFGNVATTAHEVLNPDEATWSSNAPAIGSVTAGGSAAGLTPGSATITASSGALNASGALTVIGLPAAPSGFAGAGQTTTSILWSWTDNATTELGYRVLAGTVNVSGDLAAGASVWLQAGLATNTSSLSLLAQAFNSSGTANSGAAARYTLAAVPGAPGAAGVYQTSATVSWSASGNPAGTTFQLERSTGTGFGLQFVGTATTYFDAYLTPGASHYYQVRALNGDAVATAYTSSVSVLAVPPPPIPGSAGTPVGTALGTSSTTWSWVLAAGATNYYLYRPSDISYLGSSSSGPFVLTALSPNTAYGLRVAGVNVGGTGALSPSATVYTLAAVPTGAAASSITATSLIVSWALAGNPGTTSAQLERSTSGVVYSTLTYAAVTSYADANLLGCTTYYYRVRNYNGDALATAYASFQGVTANTTPSPPSGLTATANAGGTVGLSWNLSPTEGVTGYRLYWDAGNGNVSYGAPLVALGSTTASYTTGVLASSSTYTFALRATHRCGVEESTGALAMSGAAVAAATVRAAIKEPDSGKRIAGNRVTILGELIAGTPGEVQQVLFQYKLAASTSWIDIDEANVNHTNPDFSFPYFVHVDVTGLAAGSYDLRAVAYDRSAIPDSAPPAVRVVVDPVSYDINENDDNGKVKKNQTISNSVTSVVDTCGAGANDPAVRVTIPPGIVNTTTATVSVTANPTITTAAPNGQTFVGSAIKIDLSNGQTTLNGTAEITLTYPSTVLFPSLLQIYYLNEATGQWSRDFNSVVNTASRTITGLTPHFSTFAILLGTAFAANLDSLQVYPVPFKPNGPNADEGRPFTTGDVNSGIIFANLAMGSDIKIYTLTGRLVARLDNPSIAGTVRWDARNQDGRDVASGAYFAVVTAAGQKAVVKKLVIIR